MVKQCAQLSELCILALGAKFLLFYGRNIDLFLTFALIFLFNTLPASQAGVENNTVRHQLWILITGQKNGTVTP